jgi:hypothetical protein
MKLSSCNGCGCCRRLIRRCVFQGAERLVANQIEIFAPSQQRMVTFPAMEG